MSARKEVGMDDFPNRKCARCGFYHPPDRPCGGTNSYCRYCGLQHATADHVHIPGPLKPSFFECCGARVERNACGAIGRGQHAPECPKQNAAAAPLSAPTCPACDEGWPIRSRDGKPIHIIDDSEYPRSLECSAKTVKAEVASSPSPTQWEAFETIANGWSVREDDPIDDPGPIATCLTEKNAKMIRDALNRRGEWVKVTPDTMPPDGEEVLIWPRENENGVSESATAIYAKWDGLFKMEGFTYSPTHWQPLPSPPQENRDE